MQRAPACTLGFSMVGDFHSDWSMSRPDPWLNSFHIPSDMPPRDRPALLSLLKPSRQPTGVGAASAGLLCAVCPSGPAASTRHSPHAQTQWRNTGNEAPGIRLALRGLDHLLLPGRLITGIFFFFFFTALFLSPTLFKLPKLIMMKLFKL